MVREQPDATLEQLKQRGGFQCSLKTLWYALDRLGLTRKKKSLHADQRDRPDVQTKRDEFRQEVGTIEPEKLVFVDETGVTTTMTPAYARAPRGQRVVDSVPASWETVTVIAALGLDGVRAPLVFPGSTDTAVFQAYVDQVLVPELHQGDVVVFDNIKPHLAAEVAKSIEGAGAHVLPLPPYSPDYTPIEEMFSKFKQGLRRAEARTKAGLYDAVGEVLRQRDTPGQPRLVPACRPVCNTRVNRCSHQSGVESGPRSGQADHRSQHAGAGQQRIRGHMGCSPRLF